MLKSLQPPCYGIVSTFFALSTTSILLRMYARVHITKSFGPDDWCMLAVLLFHCGQQGILYYFLHYGAGLHTDVVVASHPEWIMKLTYALFAEELYYVWMHFIIKMAFLLFYLRFATKLFRKLVYATIALNVAFTVAQWLVYCFQCIPLDTFFHHAEHPTVICLANTVLAFVPAAMTITTDILIVVLPVHSLWIIQVSLKKRLLLISLVSLGGVVVLISLLRLVVLLEFQKMTDFTWSLGKIIIISSIELEVAIMAANAPALKVFFSHNSKGGVGSAEQSRLRSRSGMRSHVYEEGEVNLEERKKRRMETPQNTCHITGNCTEEEDMYEKRHSSEEDIVKKGGSDTGIFVTSFVAVESQDARSEEGGVAYKHDIV